MCAFGWIEGFFILYDNIIIIVTCILKILSVIYHNNFITQKTVKETIPECEKIES